MCCNGLDLHSQNHQLISQVSSCVILLINAAIWFVVGKWTKVSHDGWSQSPEPFAHGGFLGSRRSSSIRMGLKDFGQVTTDVFLSPPPSQGLAAGFCSELMPYFCGSCYLCKLSLLRYNAACSAVAVAGAWQQGVALLEQLQEATWHKTVLAATCIYYITILYLLYI